MEWMILPLKRYAQFSGRSRRQEFWMWILFVVIVSVVLTVVDNLLGLGGGSAVRGFGRTGPGTAGFGGAAAMSGGVLTTIFGLATLIPNIAVAVRRLHDIDRSGWWILAPAVPYALGIGLAIAGAASQSLALMGLGGVLTLIGFILVIVLLVFYSLPGTTGPNRFGEDPLGHSGADLARTFE